LPSPDAALPADAPISAEQAVLARRSVDALTVRSGMAYWLEKRSEWNRTVLLRRPLDEDPGGPLPVMPDWFDVGSQVHEYGGGAYWVADDGTVFAVHDEDQRIYRLDPDGSVGPLTPETGSPPAHRFADLRTLPRGRLVSVRERHESDGQVLNELVVVPIDGSAPPRVVASGRDFYSFPRPDPAGHRLAFTCWDHPQMPWDGTELWLADITSDGSLTRQQWVAGGSTESLFQPEWSPDNELYVMSDRTGWWNLYRAHEDGLNPVWITRGECGEPQWEFGYSTYTFLDSQRIVILSREEGLDRLRLLDLHTGEAELLSVPATSVKPYLAAEKQLAFLGGGPDELTAPLTYDQTDGRVRLLGSEPPTAPRQPWRRLRVSRTGKLDVWVNLYPPAGSLPDDQPPPLLLRAHPGPRSQARIRLDLETLFFTSRGYAVADIDYRGSTGYGRLFRNALIHSWGVVDAEDCAAVAQHLADAGLVDQLRTVIYGESAGGYTALRALATTDVFVAAICVSAIVDLERYRQRTHKFQRYETDLLVGPFPEQGQVYHERSPAGLVRSIDRPVLFVHGNSDPIAPVEAVKTMAGVLGSGRDRALFFDHEGHPVRQSKNRTALLIAAEHFLEDVLPSRYGQ
jgi:dipeptidyl aminopeptidase/acylaminoacyl peptidase